jgi:hypothetical protein
MLRLTWAVVEETPPRYLLSLSDTMLVKSLLQNVAQKILLNGDETGALCSYLGSKVPLIRDMAESRLPPEFGLSQPLLPVNSVEFTVQTQT